MITPFMSETPIWGPRTSLWLYSSLAFSSPHQHIINTSIADRVNEYGKETFLYLTLKVVLNPLLVLPSTQQLLVITTPVTESHTVFLILPNSFPSSLL